MNAVVETQIVKNRVGNAIHLVPTEPLTNSGLLEALDAAFTQSIESHETRIVIELGNVPLLDSTILGKFRDWNDALMQRGGNLTLISVNQLSTEILAATGIIELIEVHGPRHEDDPLAETLGNGKLRLGDLLIASGVAEANVIRTAIDKQKATGARLGQILVDEGSVKSADIMPALSRQLGVRWVRLRPGLYDPTAARLLDRATAERLNVLPLFRVRDTITLATNDPTAMPYLDEVADRTGCKVRPVLAQAELIKKYIGEAYADQLDITEYVADLESDFEVVDQQEFEDRATLDEMAAGSPVVNLVNAIVQRAIRDGASDVHLEPSRKKSRVRFRIDGILYEVMSSPIEMHAPVVSRLKVMANLDITERRLPQDGRIQVSTGGRTIDLRFSSLPGIFGEKVVLRVLDKDRGILEVDKLGFSPTNKEIFTRLLGRSHGLILVTGPTGSGKTTSLYAAINHLNSTERSIVTIEDPVEYQIDIVNQNQINEQAGLSFAKLLKHVLRQDPDIVMVGEIRDRETAEIAVQAALTGHLVLSTLHTNDAVSAISRMMDMRVEPYLLSSALIGVMAQRLVRTICPDCQSTFVPSPELVQSFGWDTDKAVRLAHGRGCKTCYDSGYKGRMAIHEILETGPELQRVVIASPGRDELDQHVSASGMRTLFTDGLDRVLARQTTVEEVTRVVRTI